MKKIGRKLISVSEKDVKLLKKDPEKFWEGISEISTRAFCGLPSLKELTIPSTVTKINERIIFDCQNLEKIEINASINKLETLAFERVAGLKEVYINSEIESIDEECFMGCYELKKVSLNKGLKRISKGAFSFCRSLESIVIPSTVQSIDSTAFYDCRNLQRVKLSQKLESIGSYAFSKCQNLTSVIIPSNVENIGEKAFMNCTNLKEIYLENKTVSIGVDALSGVNIRYLYERNGKVILSTFPPYNENIKYIDINDVENVFVDFKREKMNLLIKKMNEINDIILKCKRANVKISLNFILNYLDREKASNINLKYYKQLYKIIQNDSPENIEIFCHFGETLGLFEKPDVEVHISRSNNVIVDNVDYAQKAGEFLKEKIANGQLQINHLNYILDGLKNKGFKRDYALFIFKDNNLKKILERLQMDKNFLSNIYNCFEEVQATNTNKNGYKILKPTLAKFISYFDSDKFKNTIEYSDIAREIGKFYDDQKYFDIAVQTRKTYEENDIQPNILSVNLEEKLLRKINETRDNIFKLSKEVIEELSEAAEEFTFEWLRKDDPHNYTLGKYCSCCAHLGQCGDGIAIASVVSKDVQNLILRDNKGEIIAKSTLYVNRKHGYGVFNNVEINSAIQDREKEQIYKKYVLAIKLFAELYNKENPNNPLKQINVGMGFNDLSEQIKAKNKKGKVLKSIHYIDYSNIGTHDVDSNETQYVMWEKTK